MRTKPKSQNANKKSFQWGISTASIEFMRTNALEAARDGSATDCSFISSLPLPKQNARISAKIK